MFLGGALSPSSARRSEARFAVEADASDPKVHAREGLAYVQRARDDADPSFLPRAESALQRSLDLQPADNLEAFVGMAALANARHDFSGSVRWSRRAIRTNPYSASAYGLLGDALFELGRVRRADAAYQKMVDVRPDVASYVRASYALQHHGRTKDAIAALRLALDAAGPAGDTAAWVRHQLGDVYAGMGDYRQAARQNRIGTKVAPGYVPPTVGLAESLIARGRLEDALEIMEVAANELPSLEYMITLGDLYAATGGRSDAEAQYATVAGKLAEYRRNGVLPDADFVVFYADHGLRPGAALGEARRIYRDRPTAKTADALAWMLHSLGRDRRAWTLVAEATRAAPGDADTLFHAGKIARSLGRDGSATRLIGEAMDLDPSLRFLTGRS